MSSTRFNYIFIETLISVAINTALSFAFVFIAFHGRTRIQVLGSHGIVPDMAPQAFMVTVMSCLVPGLLTRRRLRKGNLIWHGTPTRATVRQILAYAFIIAAGVTVLVTGLCWVALPGLLPSGITFATLLVSKAEFGAALAALVTPWAITRMLRA